MKCIYCKYFRIVHAMPHVNTLKVSVTLNVCPQTLRFALCISRWLMLEPVCSFNRAVAAHRATISTHCLIPRNMKHVAVATVTLRLFWCQFVPPQNKPFRHWRKSVHVAVQKFPENEDIIVIYMVEMVVRWTVDGEWEKSTFPFQFTPGQKCYPTPLFLEPLLFVHTAYCCVCMCYI